MKKIALVVGHGPNFDRGAVNANGATELDWNRELAFMISQHFRGDKDVEVQIFSRRKEKQSPVPEINASGAAIAVEFHLNSSDDEDPDLEGEASGTEMIIDKRMPKRAKELAELLREAAVSVLKLPDRGVKPPWMGRGAYFLGKTTMPAVIVESFFIDHSPDLEKGNKIKKDLAKVYAQVLRDFVLN